MKRYLQLLVSLLVCCFVMPATHVSALYDPRSVQNNKVGIHILSPSEIDEAAKLVSSNGGDWGYVTIPIQPTDRDKNTWQTFMHKAKELHLIPIIRITTIPQGGTWAKGHDTDLVDFANFLSELDWPIENRYIILFNEVNRATEWGGTVDPEKYASIVKNAQSIFKERSNDFFLLGPSLDAALPNSSTSLSASAYLNRMTAADPLIWSYFDGWSSHSYPNPGFISNPKKTGLQSIVGYKSEQSLLKLAPKPVFITETGWDQSKLNASVISANWKTAWEIWGNDPNVVAVTPFVFQGGEQFKNFSLVQNGGSYTPSGQSLYDLKKTAGTPKIIEPKPKLFKPSIIQDPPWAIPFFKSSHALFKLENIFRVVLGLPTKSQITLKDLPLSVETAQTPKQWEKGLSGRTALEPIDGMLFIFPQYHIPIFWMKDMHFPLDIIWISGGKVADMTTKVPVETGDKLPTYSPKVPVNMVLEVPSGWAEEKGITVGDQLIIN